MGPPLETVLTPLEERASAAISIVGVGDIDTGSSPARTGEHSPLDCEDQAAPEVQEEVARDVEEPQRDEAELARVQALSLASQRFEDATVSQNAHLAQIVSTHTTQMDTLNTTMSNIATLLGDLLHAYSQRTSDTLPLSISDYSFPSPQPQSSVPSSLPGPSVVSPFPGPSVASSLPGPSVVPPLPGPSVASPLPGPSVASPLPGPSVASSLPAPSVASSLPAPSVASPLPGLSVASFLPGLSVAYPLPGLSVASPLPGLSVASSLPGLSVAYPLPGLSVAYPLPGPSVASSLLSPSVPSSFLEPTLARLYSMCYAQAFSTPLVLPPATPLVQPPANPLVQPPANPPGHDFAPSQRRTHSAPLVSLDASSDSSTSRVTRSHTRRSERIPFKKQKKK